MVENIYRLLLREQELRVTKIYSGGGARKKYETIFLSPEASIEGAKSGAYIGGGSKSLFRDGKLEIISTSIERKARNFSKFQSLFRGKG